ncbi:hypothetical protein PINS_up012754 [Pythium insidiosum]|nr:hypothetical protein PINS_up012754 [Pythium insidiosum]
MRRVLVEQLEDDVTNSKGWDRCDHAVVWNLIRLTSRLKTAYKSLSEELEGLVRTAPGAPPPLSGKNIIRVEETPL